MKAGVELIAEERQRQIEQEGYTAEHDSQHNANEFVLAAKAYIDCNFPKTHPIDTWPWLSDGFKPKDYISNLKRAGALIAAAIDKMQVEDNVV